MSVCCPDCGSHDVTQDTSNADNLIDNILNRHRVCYECQDCQLVFECEEDE